MERKPEGKVVEDKSTLMAVSEMAVLRALELSGNRLSGRRGRGVWTTIRDLPAWEFHTRLVARDDELDRIMQSAWTLPRWAGLPELLIGTLDSYVRILLTTGLPFSRRDLERVLSGMAADEVRLPWCAMAGK